MTTSQAVVWRNAATVMLTSATLLFLGPGAGATFTDQARSTVGIRIGTVAMTVARATVTSSTSSQGSCENCEPLNASTAIVKDRRSVSLHLRGQAQSLDVIYTVTLQNTGTLPATARVVVTGRDTETAIARSLTVTRADESSTTLAALETGQTWFTSATVRPGDQTAFTVAISGRELDQSAPWSVAPLFTLITEEVPTPNNPPVT